MTVIEIVRGDNLVDNLISYPPEGQLCKVQYNKENLTLEIEFPSDRTDVYKVVGGYWKRNCPYVIAKQTIYGSELFSIFMVKNEVIFFSGGLHQLFLDRWKSAEVGDFIKYRSTKKYKKMRMEEVKRLLRCVRRHATAAEWVAQELGIS